MENSFHSRGSKNFVLKSDYLNNTNNSKHNSKKNLSFYDTTNGQNQKSLFRGSTSFAEQEEEDNKRERLKSNASNKESESNFFNNIIFNDLNENTNWNKPKSNHSNIIQEYYQNIDDNIELFNNQFSNMNLYNNEANDQNNFGSLNINNKNNIENNNNNNLNALNNNSNNLGTMTNSPNYVNNIQGEFINNKNINETNNIDKDNFVSINSGLNTQNDFNSQLMLNPFIENNNHNPNFFSSNMRSNLQNNTFNQNNLKSDNMLKKKDDNLINNCVSLCKEQMECRLLQKKIEEDPSLASTVIYDKIKDKVQEISCDQFGNYFIQKVIEYLNEKQIKELLQKKISSNFRAFCFNQHGTRVVQKIFEKIINNDELLNYYNLLLTPNLKDFVIDQNACHIIIKYVNMLSYPKNHFIIQFLLENSFDLATKKHSCCVLQKCIEYSNEKQKKDFLKEIATKSFGLFNDQFGNYVVQYCINLCDFEINKIFVENFLNNILQFSTQKYSSNIIEKCMDCCDEETKELIIQKFSEPYIIEKLLFDMYGNYVLQKIMGLSKEPMTSKYISVIGPLMKKLNSYSFGLKLYNKLISSFPALSSYVGNKNEGGKMKKMKKNKNNMNFINKNNLDGFNEGNQNNMNSLNMNNLYSNMYNNNRNNIQMNYMINNKINNKFQNNQMIMPGNNFYLPFQFGNNNMNNNNMYFHNMMNNTNNMGMNFNNNNTNNFMQFQQNMNNNNDSNNIIVPNISMFNFNNQQ